jgi:hypothetical protein
MWSSRSALMRTGHCTAGKGASYARAALLLSLAAIALGGCSSAAPLPSSGLISVFASSDPPRSRVPIDMEDDGREAQRPPPARMFERQDDPTQPFSPNYGEVPLPQHPDDSEDAPRAPA